MSKGVLIGLCLLCILVQINDTISSSESEGKYVILIYEISLKGCDIPDYRFTLYYKEVPFNWNGSLVHHGHHHHRLYTMTSVHASRVSNTLYIILTVKDRLPNIEIHDYICKFACGERNVMEEHLPQLLKRPGEANCSLVEGSISSQNSHDHHGQLECSAEDGYPSGCIVCFSEEPYNTIARWPKSETVNETIHASFSVNTAFLTRCCSASEYFKKYTEICTDYILVPPDRNYEMPAIHPTPVANQSRKFMPQKSIEKYDGGPDMLGKKYVESGSLTICPWILTYISVFMFALQLTIS